MRNCTQSRPANHNVKSSLKPLQVPPAYSSSYIGAGVPSSMYLGGGSPYGPSHFSGSSLPSYDYPFSGGSGFNYGYGNRFSVGNPYGTMPVPGPAPYTSGAMMGAGGMYGLPPFMDRYGVALPMGQSPLGARPGSYYDEGAQKKPTGSGRDNDWTCPKCGNNNFSFRTVCNMRKCNTPRPEAQNSKLDNAKGSESKMLEGSWKCEKCGNINYSFREKCNRKNCGAEKPETNETSAVATGEDDQ